jgi:1-aminocyclopropane-1-carboxylate deaminase
MTIAKQLQWAVPSPLQSVPLPKAWKKACGSASDILYLKRDDLIHPVVSGNKARKLLQLATQWCQHKPAAVMTMGGNRSNFLHALGYLCHQWDIPMIAKVRGHRPPHLAATLSDLSRWGVTLEFVDKENFRQYRENPQWAAHEAQAQGAVWIPEGGGDVSALAGLITAVEELTQPPEVIFVPVGTGVTALGLALGVQKRGWQTPVIGVVVVKGADYLSDSLWQLCRSAGWDWPSNLVLEHRFCGRGFGKVDHELLAHQKRFETLLEVPLEPVYLTKCCLALESYFLDAPAYRTELTNCHQPVLLWHTGGLQGNR